MNKKIILRSLIVLSLLFTCFLNGYSQHLPENPYVSKMDPDAIPDYFVSKADLQNDIDIYISKIEKVHPDPYRLIFKDEFISETNKIKVEIALENENINIIDCYYYLQKLAVLIRDGHTKIYKPNNWEKLETTFFPLNIKIIEGRVFVNANFGDNEIPIKAEILSINNRNSGEIITEMLNYCEGTFREFKLFRIEEEFRYFIHTFYKSKVQWKVDYVFNGVKKSTSIDGISYELLKKKNKRNVWFSESSVKIKNKEVPIFNLPHLGYRKEDFKPVIDKFFNDHMNRKNIIIDLRGCPGGNGHRAYEVVDHLIDRPYSISKKFSFRVSQVLKDYIKYYVQGALYEKKKSIDQWKDILYTTGIWNDEYDDMYKIVLGSDLKTFVQTNKKSHSPDKKISKYKGNIFLLIDHRSFSAAVVFASIFKHFKLATIVGRETGGRVDFFSDAVNIELPKSKLIMKIPTAMMTLHGSNLQRGIIPDRVVNFTVEDFLNGNDPDIEALKEIIK